MLLAIGCEKPVTEAPPVVKFGQDVCVHCNMILTDDRNVAASIVSQEGKLKALLFDDIGDQLDYHRQHPELDVRKRYVTDHRARQWVEFEQAHFVHAERVHTPMGSGIVALSSEASAQAFAAEHEGRVVPALKIGAVRAGLGAETDACCGGSGGE